MLYLSNTLLTFSGIATAFIEEVLSKNKPHAPNAPAPLIVLKERLSAIYNLRLEDSASSLSYVDLAKHTQRFVGRSQPKTGATTTPSLALAFPTTKTHATSSHLLFEKQTTTTPSLSPYCQDVTALLHAILNFPQCRLLDYQGRFARTKKKCAVTIVEELFGIKPCTFTSKEKLFIKINQHYRLFTPSQKIQALFNLLYPQCELMLTVVEKNLFFAGPLCALSVYKIMALTVSDALIEKMETHELIYHIGKRLVQFLKIDHAHATTPYTTALETIVLPKAMCPIDLTTWQTLFLTYGLRAANYFSKASAITQSQTLPSPRSLAQLDRALACLYYGCDPRFIEFAMICYRHKVSRFRFQQGINLLQKRGGLTIKKMDNIPSFVITSPSVLTDERTPKYVLIKMPALDLHQLILGDIVGCCMSVGSTGQPCIEDALTKANNGIYVLLRNDKTTALPYIIEGKINTAHFSIVGFSYVWKSQFGNICFDSIDALSSVPIDTVRTLFIKLANKFIAHGIGTRVTGGANKFFNSALYATQALELMEEGYVYGDAKRQFIIAENMSLLSRTQPAAEYIAVLTNHYPELDKSQLEEFIKLRAPKFNIEHIYVLAQVHQKLVKTSEVDSLFSWLAYCHDSDIDLNEDSAALTSLSLFANKDTYYRHPYRKVLNLINGLDYVGRITPQIYWLDLPLNAILEYLDTCPIPHLQGSYLIALAAQEICQRSLPFCLETLLVRFDQLLRVIMKTPVLACAEVGAIIAHHPQGLRAHEILNHLSFHTDFPDNLKCLSETLIHFPYVFQQRNQRGDHYLSLKELLLPEHSALIKKVCQPSFVKILERLDHQFNIRPSITTLTALHREEKLDLLMSEQAIQFYRYSAHSMEDLGSLPLTHIQHIIHPKNRFLETLYTLSGRQRPSLQRHWLLLSSSIQKHAYFTTINGCHPFNYAVLAQLSTSELRFIQRLTPIQLHTLCSLFPSNSLTTVLKNVSSMAYQSFHELYIKSQLSLRLKEKKQQLLSKLRFPYAQYEFTIEKLMQVHHQIRELYIDTFPIEVWMNKLDQSLENSNRSAFMLTGRAE